jgi:hypothetical protein
MRLAARWPTLCVVYVLNDGQQPARSNPEGTVLHQARGAREDFDLAVMRPGRW